MKTKIFILTLISIFMFMFMIACLSPSSIDEKEELDSNTCDDCDLTVEGEQTDFVKHYVPEEDQEIMKEIYAEIAEKYPLETAKPDQFSERGTNPSRQEIYNIMKTVGAQYDIPCEILYGIGYEESGLRQYNANGTPIISGDNGIGIMQVTPGAVSQNFDEYSLKYNIQYNIEAGAQVILGKWNYVTGRNPIGDNDPMVLENWYFALWAYNGYCDVNNPNHYVSGPKRWCNSSICWWRYDAYQDEVLDAIHTLLNINVTHIPRTSLPSTGIPPYGQSYPTPTPTHMSELVSGSFAKAATIMHPTNQAEAFMRGRDGQLYHSWQNYQNSDSWSSWYPFSGQTVGNPVATKQQNGNIVLFSRGVNGDVIRMTKYSSGWGSWNSLGGVTYSDPAVGQNADGRLQVFVRGTNNRIYTKYQQWNNSSSYSGWIDKGNTTEHSPTVAKNQNGRLQLFIRKSTNGASLYMKQQSASGVNNWTVWYTSGGVIQEAPTVINYNGCIYQFARGTTGYVYYRKQASANSGSWTGWTSIGSTVATSPVTAGVGANGDLMIFIRGNDNAIYSTYYDTYWHGWQSQGGVLTSAPAVGKYSNGRLFITARGNNGRMYIKRQNSSYNSTSWTGWWMLGDNVDRF